MSMPDIWALKGGVFLALWTCLFVYNIASGEASPRHLALYSIGIVFNLCLFLWAITRKDRRR